MNILWSAQWKSASLRSRAMRLSRLTPLMRFRRATSLRSFQSMFRPFPVAVDYSQLRASPRRRRGTVFRQPTTGHSTAVSVTLSASFVAAGVKMTLSEFNLPFPMRLPSKTLRRFSAATPLEVLESQIQKSIGCMRAKKPLNDR